MKNQKGFTVVEGLLVVIALTLISFAGWYVFNANKADEKNDTSTSTAAKSNSKSDEADQLPEGFVKFSSTEAGITFGYPETWGEAKIGPSRESDHLIKGKEFEISFSKNENVTAGLRSKDREHDPDKGHGGIPYAAAYAAEDFNSLNEKTGDTTQLSAGSALHSGPLYSLGCEGVGSILVSKVEGNTSFESIAFLYFDKRIDYDNPDDSLCDKYKSYISQAHIDELKGVSATIKKL